MKILLYLDRVLIADVNTIAKNRKLEESLKSEQTSATSDQFSFEMNWLQFKHLAEKRFDEDPMSLLRIGGWRARHGAAGLRDVRKDDGVRPRAALGGRRGPGDT